MLADYTTAWSTVNHAVICFPHKEFLDRFHYLYLITKLISDFYHSHCTPVITKNWGTLIEQSHYYNSKINWIFSSSYIVQAAKYKLQQQAVKSSSKQQHWCEKKIARMQQNGAAAYVCMLAAILKLCSCCLLVTAVCT